MKMNSDSDKVSSEEALRKIIKSYPKVLDKRIQPGLDAYSIEFIQLASIAALAFSDLSLGMPLIDLKSCQLSIKSPSQLSFNTYNSFNKSNVRYVPCSLYFLIPGVGHGLRVNGTAYLEKSNDKHNQDTKVVLDIRGVYLHCARAITRAKLWNTQIDSLGSESERNQKFVLSAVDAIAENIIASSPYALLATQDAKGDTELSPRGDPAGFVKFIDEETLLLPERPGNKVAISLTNIIRNPAVGLTFLIPGLNQTLYVEGSAHITANQALLKPLAIKEKIPKLGIVISIQRVSLNFPAALESAGIWQQERHVSSKSLTSFSKALTAHMQGEGLLGKLSVPIVSGIIKHDMNNLY